jgi:hypothetical protein
LRSGEIVRIYDALDNYGNGNVRFSGTVDGALSMLAWIMDENDHLKKTIVTPPADTRP